MESFSIYESSRQGSFGFEKYVPRGWIWWARCLLFWLSWLLRVAPSVWLGASRMGISIYAGARRLGANSPHCDNPLLHLRRR